MSQKQGQNIFSPILGKVISVLARRKESWKVSSGKTEMIAERWGYNKIRRAASFHSHNVEEQEAIRWFLSPLFHSIIMENTKTRSIVRICTEFVNCICISQKKKVNWEAEIAAD